MQKKNKSFSLGWTIPLTALSNCPDSASVLFQFARFKRWTAQNEQKTPHQSPELKPPPAVQGSHSPYLSGHVAARQNSAQGISVVIKVSVGVLRNILGSSEFLWVTGRTLSTKPAGHKTHSDWNRSLYISQFLSFEQRARWVQSMAGAPMFSIAMVTVDKSMDHWTKC